MDIAIFQRKLEQLCQMAEENHKELTTEQVKEVLGDGELEVEQLLQVLRYLKGKGIEILGMGEAEASEESPLQGQLSGTKAPLSKEEEAYLRGYLAELDEPTYGGNAWKELLTRWVNGDAAAKADLLAFYLPYTARRAAEYHCEEITLADLIQEANVGLLLALDDYATAVNHPGAEDLWIEEQIQKGIQDAVCEMTDQKMRDDVLVNRVEKLEAAVKDLTDEEDGELKFSVAELAVILDMKEEEIRDILRLTGDDK